MPENLDNAPHREKQYGGVIADPTDLRDLIYRPSLALLPDSYISAAVDPRKPECNKLLQLRNQADRYSCVGEALAAVIDIQRIEALSHRGNVNSSRTTIEPASAAMLYAMAIEIESVEQGKATQDIRSLRSGLKGFYNTGVCSEKLWTNSYVAQSPVTLRFDDATVEIMRQARGVTLGAYYKVRSFINDYHSALVEAGALYVAADAHKGWEKPENGKIGKLPPQPPSTPAGPTGHAFAIVGYTKDGFLVLNSWGGDWGGYQLDGRALRGIALWPYEDWAANVLDCWVVRLASPTPDAFRFTLGVQGQADFSDRQTNIAKPSVRRLEVLGRYIHLEDGCHVEKGSHASSPRSLATTLDKLKKANSSDLKAIKLTIYGDTSSTDELMYRIRRSIVDDNKLNIHGFGLVWVNGLLHGAAAALQPLFEEALKIAGGKREDANCTIEQKTRPVGRAIWRDAKRSAAKAAGKQGHAFCALKEITSVCREKKLPLHIVVEGAGALLWQELLVACAREIPAQEALFDVLGSLTLVVPLCTTTEYNRSIAPFLRRWKKQSTFSATLFKADETFNERLTVGLYSRSWTDLVSRAFEEPGVMLAGEPDRKAGGREASVVQPRIRGGATIKRLRAPDGSRAEFDSSDLLSHKDITNHVTSKIVEFQTSS